MACVIICLIFVLCMVNVCTGMGWFTDIPRRQAPVMRRLALKVPIGCVAPISGSYGPKRVGVLEPWSQTRGAVVTACQVVLPSQVQYPTIRKIRPRLTGPLRNQHNSSFLGYLVLEVP